MPTCRRHDPFRRAAGLLASLAALWLAACAAPPTSWTPEADSTASAEAAFSRGEYGLAAQNWQRQALEAEPDRAAALRVRAADAWLLAGEPGNATDALRWVDREALSPGDAARMDLALADLALRRGRPDEAEALLRNARGALPNGSRKRYDSLNSKVLEALSSPGSRDIARAAERVRGMPYYDPDSAVDLVRSLENVSSHELAIRSENPRGERQLTGWLDLVLVIRQNLVNPENVSSAMTDWKSRHPTHLLSTREALDTWLRYRQTFRPPRRIGVLLPQSGRLQAAGDAIRDGLMSAYLEHSGGSEILFFATGDDEQSAISAYFNALDAGVDLIVGPLRKESVEAMLGLAGMSTPVLALNELPEGFSPPRGLAGQVTAISLSQDRETRSIARRLADSGYENAIVIAPEGAWGERMALAFESEFLRDDRTIVAAARYLESENDHSASLERVLKIDESNARGKRLENTLQMTIEFEPVRRQDVDVIFLAANSTQARLLRPQLRFYDAGDIPTYATARIFSGQPDPARNRDLDGVRFPATPWQLSHGSRQDIPDLASIRGGSLGSLYALGRDAWNLLPWLELMQKDPDFVFAGQSGYYRRASGPALDREPDWAEFRQGRPSPVPAAGSPPR